MRERLLAWLDAGCPHYQFRMDWGLAEITTPDPEAGLECGTVCCIAGYVAEQEGLHPEVNSSAEWLKIQSLALDALDLPTEDGVDFGHPLFSVYLAPAYCTPERAAIAARFAFENPHHPNPWRATE